VNWNKGPFRSVLGGAYNVYDGDHFGELVWMDIANQAEPGDLYYLSNGYKTDFNVFGKTTCKLTDKLSAYVDLQVRKVTYETRGLDSDRRFIDVADSLLFFNPKVGINHQLSYHDRLYVSYAQGHREPTRGDYIDIAVGQKPKPESMTDIELGYQRSTSKYSVGMNLFYMDYSDQLVLTGELNDVGTPLRQNVDRSFRRGLEIDFGWNIMERLNWSANVTLSQNQIKEFNETLYDYTNGYDIIKNGYTNTDIAFSPSMVAASQLTYRIRLRNNEFVELGWMAKYVGQQFMDNTGNSDRALDAYLVNDARLTYTLLNRGLKEFRVNLLVNNFLSEEYSSNGYTYSYIYGQQITENFYYPQAGRNFLLGVELKF
jgi:iron complex outermembrane recepter protein